MDKKEVLLMKINKAIDAYEQEYQVSPLTVFTGFKPLSDLTVQDVLITYDEKMSETEFKVI